MKKIDFTAWFLSAALLGLLSLSHVSDSWAGGITSPGAARGRNADITSLQNLHGSAGIITNTIVGDFAGDSIKVGANTVVLGDGALQSASTTNDTVAVGHFSLQNYTDSVGRDVCVGSDCQLLGAGGYANTFVGFQVAAFSSLVTGTGNVALGDTAFYRFTSADSDVVIGQQSGQNITSGSANTIVGAAAAPSLQTGTNNVCLGYSSCAGVGGSYQLRIDSIGVANPLISGTFDQNGGGAGTLNIYGTLTVNTKKVLSANDTNAGQACTAITVGVSPFAYTATLGGDVTVAGGMVSGMTKTRAAVVVWNSLLSSDDIPVRAGDIITVTYTAAPTIYQCAN